MLDNRNKNARYRKQTLLATSYHLRFYLGEETFAKLEPYFITFNHGLFIDESNLKTVMSILHTDHPKQLFEIN